MCVVHRFVICNHQSTGMCIMCICDVFTIQNNFVVSWSGWSDSFSGIKQYHLMLYKMDVVNNKLSNNNVEPIVHTTVNAGENFFNSTLSEPGKNSLHPRAIRFT